MQKVGFAQIRLFSPPILIHVYFLNTDTDIKSQTMHRLPDQHFPDPVCCRIEEPHPLDSCGHLAAVKTFAESSTGAEGGGHVFRTQYGLKSRSGCALYAEEETVPFLFPYDWESKLRKKSSKGRLVCLFYLILPEELGEGDFYRYHAKLTIGQFQQILRLFGNIIMVFLFFLTLQYLLLDFRGYGRDGARIHNLLVTPIVSLML